MHRCFLLAIVLLFGLSTASLGDTAAPRGTIPVRIRDADVDPEQPWMVTRKKIEALGRGMTPDEVHAALGRVPQLRTDAGTYYHAARGGLYFPVFENGRLAAVIHFPTEREGRFVFPGNLRDKAARR